MNNEIIEFLLFKLEQNYKCEKEDYFILYKPDIKDLLDYITNLQQENEKLKELCDKYEEEHNTAFKLWKMKMEEIPTYEEKEDYKSRIDKAVEYISSNCILSDEWEEIGFCQFIPRGSISYKPLSKKKVEKLLEILKGDSDD